MHFRLQDLNMYYFTVQSISYKTLCSTLH